MRKRETVGVWQHGAARSVRAHEAKDGSGGNAAKTLGRSARGNPPLLSASAPPPNQPQQLLLANKLDATADPPLITDN